MAAGSTYYITTPIYYVNDVPHIGHAYTTLACDVLARFMRLDGVEVKFLTGTDEHGQKNEKAAEKAGIDPQAFVDKVSENFRQLVADMNYSNDDFIRTTEQRHKTSCQALWKRLVENDQIYLGSYAGWYAVRDEAYYGEDELTTSPDGRKLAPSGAEAEWVEEPSYFFKLSEWQDRLLEFYETNPGFIAPETRRNEMISFVRSGLRDLSVSRTTFKWGVPVPGDPDHVMYVWIDALTNYITAVGYPDVESADFAKFWPADLHMVGKDILRFHTIYWPAFLMGAGIAPPKRVFGHGWLLNRGEKMSKSVGNVLRAEDLVARYGLDPVRYYLLREVPFGADGYISHETMAGRINSDLANDFGNLCQRVLSMIAKNCGAKMPEPAKLEAADEVLLGKTTALLATVRDLLTRDQAFHTALINMWEVVGEANRYVDDQAPWALRKTDPGRMATVLYVLARAIRNLALLAQPFMPDSAGAMLDQLAVPAAERDFSGLEVKPRPGTALPAPTPVFPRYVEPEKPV